MFVLEANGTPLLLMAALGSPGSSEHFPLCCDMTNNRTKRQTDDNIASEGNSPATERKRTNNPEIQQHRDGLSSDFLPLPV